MQINKFNNLSTLFDTIDRQLGDTPIIDFVDVLSLDIKHRALTQLGYYSEQYDGLEFDKLTDDIKKVIKSNDIHYLMGISSSSVYSVINNDELNSTSESFEVLKKQGLNKKQKSIPEKSDLEVQEDLLKSNCEIPSVEYILSLGKNIKSSIKIEKGEALRVRNLIRILSKKNPVAFKKLIREILEHKDSQEILKDCGIQYTGSGFWNLCGVPTINFRNIIIGLMIGEIFPSSSWNIENNIGNTKGLIKSYSDFSDMLVSLGYDSNKITVPIETWNEKISMTDYNNIVKFRLESPESIEELSKYGIYFNGNDKSWILKKMSGFTIRNIRVAGKSLHTFPCIPWLTKIGIQKGVMSLGTKDFKTVLLALGYNSVTLVN